VDSIVERILAGAELPPRLRDLRSPPAELHAWGELPRGPALAVVGTRRSTEEGEAYARRLCAQLARSGVAILSGGALGIDTAAHTGALEAGGTTVVVAPCGFERPYPASNTELFRRILRSGGAYVSLVGGDVAATSAAFFSRNACLVALAHAVVMVQAPIRSGARNALAQARRLGRPVLVAPEAPWRPEGAGCIAELKLGARPIGSCRDVLAVLQAQGLRPIQPIDQASDPQLMLMWGLTESPCSPAAPGAARLKSIRGPYPAADDPQQPAKASTPCSDCSCVQAASSTGSAPDPARERVFDAVQRGANHVDQVCKVTGLPASRVQCLLLALELDGRIRCEACGLLTLA
jgi:DNA processing protein